MVKGGYILQPRCIDDSWIAHAAPVVRETWAFLLRRANHKDQKYNGFIVKRGQLFITYREIRDALAWKIGFRFERYHESQMKRGMKALMNNGMIELASEPRGNLITICNYDFYQDPGNYERTSERTNSEPVSEPIANQHRSAINKNVKNGKNGKNDKKKSKAYAPTGAYLPKFNAFNYLVQKGVEKQIAKDWLATRKAKRLANTETAFKQIGLEIKKTGCGWNEILRLCCERGWGGFKDSWDWKEVAKSQNNGGNGKMQETIDCLQRFVKRGENGQGNFREGDCNTPGIVSAK